MKRKYYFLPLLLILIAIGFLVVKFTQSLVTKQSQQIIKTPAPLPKEVTINLDKNGFSPKDVTIKPGTAIVWKNTSGDKQTVNSDNYPTNQLHRELNFGIFANNSSVTYTFTKPGTYGYHNQLHPDQTGEIIVN